MNRGRALVILLPLLALYACETARTHQTFWFTGTGMEEHFQHYQDVAPPAAKAVLDELKRDPRVRIHFLRGQLRRIDSRGAASGPHSSPATRDACFWHPVSETENIDPRFDWDVIYDEAQQQRSRASTGFESPVEALLHHELMGHFLRCYRSGRCNVSRDEQGERWVDAELDANERENEFRQHRKLPLIDWTYPRAPVEVQFR